MIFQSFNLLMQRTCPGQHLFPLEAHRHQTGRREKRALELLGLVGL